ncbi:peptidase, M24 family [Dictyocaulus viviparus]|uniref:Peptidase, M24 family n=1 Tax=Dictyocaulus viviparus TaxID=29172 RepID=A0A0D8XDP0_DICVI|nr:peptidase, M24 family [Dictyocaulus viviparus]
MEYILTFQWNIFTIFLLCCCIYENYITDQDLVILLKGAGRSFIAPDVPGTYRQCSHFRYITGVTVPNCYYLIYAQKGKANPTCILFMDRRSVRDELWEGSLPDESILELTAGFTDLLPTKKIYEAILTSKMASSNSSLFFESDDWANTEVAEICNKYDFLDTIRTYIDCLRLSKSEAEVESMRDVCELGSKVVMSTIAGCRGFENESAIAGLLEFEARRRGAEMLAYPPVIAAGKRANIIHYLDANQPIGKNDCVLMDAGCDFNGYVSDITRCYPISGNFNSTQRILYDALLHVHEQLLIYANETSKASSTLYVTFLNSIKPEFPVVSIEIAESLCPHHVSHYLGMDVHDCVTVSRDIDVPLGTVFTIEPGLYIPVDSRFPKEFHGIGLRLEDDVVTCKEAQHYVLHAYIDNVTITCWTDGNSFWQAKLNKNYLDSS